MSNPYKVWKRKHLDTLEEMEEAFKWEKPITGGGDTESTGLHIIKDKVFLIVFGWLIPNKDYGRVYTFYHTPENMQTFFHLANRLEHFVWWNVKYDLHMMKNAGFSYTEPNLVEGMAVARLVVEAIPARKGGDSLKLKDIGVKYVHPEANESEKLIKAELKKINDARIKVLTAALKQYPLEGEFTPTGRQKFWGKKAIEDFLKDPTQDVEELPKEIAEVWLDWQEEYPEATYEDIGRDLMIKYAGEDVITMLEYFKKAYPVLLGREQLDILKLENKVILPLFRMERVGIRTDQKYLIDSRARMKAYITNKRHRMYEIAGEKVTVGQHQRIVEIYKEKWDMNLPSADKAVMKKIKQHYKGEAKEFAELIKELRTLEKWYSTYLLRIIKITEYDGRFYTQIAQCSAVSGRVGSDAQQFPKDPILTEAGNKLKDEGLPVPVEEQIFHPRRAFVITGNGYDRTYYVDQSQVELRVQANYTLLVSGGDTNLCRAYMPFKCHRTITTCGNKQTKVPYDYSIKLNRDEWDKHDWYFNEAPETKWTPTDVHSETTHNALVLLGYVVHEKYLHYIYEGKDEPFFARNIDDKGFQVVRYKGKIFNFMKNYGGGMKAAMEQLDLPEKVAKAMIEGFSMAFPHVIKYQNKVQRQHAIAGFVKNMSGRRYYLKDNGIAYKLANYLVQGTCADELKKAMVAIDEYLLDKKSRFQMNIHDECSIEVWNGEEYVIPVIQKMLSSFDWALVPILADVEYTEGSWAEKESVS
jgi:DNA polymerase-1